MPVSKMLKEPGHALWSFAIRFRGKMCPIRLEVELKIAIGMYKSVSDQQEHFFQPEPDQVVRPHQVQFGESLHNMDGTVIIF